MPDKIARYRLLKLPEANPALSQRQFAEEPGVSAGKINFCVSAMLDKGLVTVRAAGPLRLK